MPTMAPLITEGLVNGVFINTDEILAAGVANDWGFLVIDIVVDGVIVLVIDLSCWGSGVDVVDVVDVMIVLVTA